MTTQSQNTRKNKKYNAKRFSVVVFPSQECLNKFYELEVFKDYKNYYCEENQLKVEEVDNFEVICETHGLDFNMKYRTWKITDENYNYDYYYDVENKVWIKDEGQYED
jgi:hypothetical protein